MTFIFFFLFSLLGILGFFALKAVEKRRGRVFAPLVREKSDAALEALILSCVKTCRQFNREMLQHFFNAGLFHGHAHGARLIHHLRVTYGALSDRVRGKRELVNNGSASHFLRQVSEYKNGRSASRKEEAIDF